MKNTKGFTLIELLLVIGIIAVLAIVVFVSLDPVKRFSDARDARRVSDLQSMQKLIIYIYICSFWINIINIFSKICIYLCVHV